jgi:branched-chain amino acid transport system ATP-binding protein
MSPVLQVQAVSRYFGGVRAVDNVSFELRPGEIFGVIGPNGAGKTTLFNVITGAIRPSSGTVRLQGEDITGLTMDAVARRGVIRTFQATTVFKRESVIENLRRGFLFGRVSRPSHLLARSQVASARQQAQKKVEEIVEFTGLGAFGATRGGDLPYGLQKILGVGMAVAAGPRLMLMDEPAAGLNPSETNEMADLVLRLRDRLGIDVVLVEHDMTMVMRICDRILVLNYGQPVCIGTPAQVQSDPAVVEAYLGAEYERA